MTEYKDRDPIELDKLGDYFNRHMKALTEEHLEGKAEIAAELGYRDWQIDQLRLAIEKFKTGDRWVKCKKCKWEGFFSKTDKVLESNMFIPSSGWDCEMYACPKCGIAIY